MGRLTPISDAMLDAAVEAVSGMELGPVDLAVVDRALNPAVVALAILMCEVDTVSFAERWHRAGDDWVERGVVLRDAILYVLTPEGARAPTSGGLH